MVSKLIHFVIPTKRFQHAWSPSMVTSWRHSWVRAGSVAAACSVSGQYLDRVDIVSILRRYRVDIV